MFCTRPYVHPSIRLPVCLPVSGTPSGIVPKFTAATHLESSMNWLDLVLNFQAWHFISKRTKVSFTLSTSCSAASLLHPTFSSGADKMSRSSAVRFPAGGCYFCILTHLDCADPLSCRIERAHKRFQSQKKNKNHLSGFEYYCNLNLSRTVLSAYVAHWTVPHLTAHLYSYADIQSLLKLDILRFTRCWNLKYEELFPTKASADCFVCIVLRYFVVSNMLLSHYGHALSVIYDFKKTHWFSISSTPFRIKVT